MSEDEVQYIGMRTAPRTSGQAMSYPFLNPMRRVMGLVLHVSEHNSQSAHRMVFQRSRTAVVNIGRKPSADVAPKPQDTEPTEAMFRCPVISRRHAKIAFTDSGHVYIIDLHSHHGTHILRPGGTVSKMLEPETPTMLSDGDIVTFGKTVGRDSEIVRPVTTRVELLCDAHSSNAPSLPSLFTFTNTSMATLTDLAKTSPKSASTSGRYGLPDSEDSSSISDHDSEIEEVPAPSSHANHPPNHVDTSCHNSFPGLPSLRALDLLKRLLPPAHDPSAHSPSISEDINHPSEAPWYGGLVDVLDSPSVERCEPSERENSQLQSRFTSPMDLSSPSPAPSLPAVIGAWPDSRPPSRSEERGAMQSPPLFEEALPLSLDFIAPPPVATPPPPPSPPPELPVDITVSAKNVDENQAADALSTTSHEAVLWASRAPSVTPLATWNAFEEPISPAHPEYESSRPESPSLEHQRSSGPSVSGCGEGPSEKEKIDDLQDSFKNINNELARLQAHRRKYKARFNSNVLTISGKLESLDDRVADVNNMYAYLEDLLEETVQTDIPVLSERMDELEERTGLLATSPALHESVKAALADRDDVKSSVAALDALVTEMKSLRENTEQQMAAELEAVRTARVAALASIAAEAKTSELRSLKRKVSSLDEPAEGPSDSGSEVAVPATAVLHVGAVAAPPRKRARVVSAVVQTATAVTLGAVAAWSALAFS